MEKSIRTEQKLASVPVFAMATVAALGATMAGAGVALAQQAEASPAGSDVAVSASEQAVSGQVKPAHVEGTFSFTQGQITPTAQIAHDLGGANKVLCGASQEVLPSNQQVASDAADWQITVDGDGVQSSLTATIGDLAQTGTQSTVMGCSCAGNPADGRATANAAVTGVSVYQLLEAAGGVSDEANAITFVSSVVRAPARVDDCPPAQWRASVCQRGRHQPAVARLDLCAILCQRCRGGARDLRGRGPSYPGQPRFRRLCLQRSQCRCDGRGLGVRIAASK